MKCQDSDKAKVNWSGPNMSDRDLEHPALTRCLRDGYPNGYTAEPEKLDVSEAEFIEIVLKRKEKNMNEAKTELIIVKQLPIIEERLRSLSEVIDIKVQDALSMVCTEDSVKGVKIVRADLNKQFAELEEQRKAVKAAVLDPYNAFEAVYKECVSLKFNAADSELKRKIDSVEDELKSQKEDEVKKYYFELASAYGIDFIPWEKAGVKVILSSSVKSLKEQINRGLSRVLDDLEIISKQTYRDEILAEYKQSLNLSQAITHVDDIHRSMEAEAVRREENAETEKRSEVGVQRVETFAPPEVIAPAGAVETAEPMYTMAFRVTGSLAQLKALKQYMSDNGINAEKVEG